MCSPFELTALLFWKPNHCELKAVNERGMMICELMRGENSKHKRKIINKVLLSVSPESTIYFSCIDSVAVGPPCIGMGTKMEVGIYWRLNSVLLHSYLQSALLKSLDATVNRFCLPSCCPMPQNRVDFMLFISVPVQMLLLSPERLLANEHSVQRKALHLHDAFCKKGLGFTAPLLLQLFHLVTSCKKKIKGGYSLLMLF